VCLNVSFAADSKQKVPASDINSNENMAVGISVHFVDILQVTCLLPLFVVFI